MNFVKMPLIEQVVFLLPLAAITGAALGVVKRGWSFASSLYWRVCCFLLPVLPMLIGSATFGICWLVRYDNGSASGFHPDAFAFDCFGITPFFILVAVPFSVLAKGMRIVALSVNIGLAMVWIYAIFHITM